MLSTVAFLLASDVDLIILYTYSHFESLVHKITDLELVWYISDFSFLQNVKILICLYRYSFLLEQQHILLLPGLGGPVDLLHVWSLVKVIHKMVSMDPL